MGMRPDGRYFIRASKIFAALVLAFKGWWLSFCILGFRQAQARNSEKGSRGMDLLKITILGICKCICSKEQYQPYASAQLSWLPGSAHRLLFRNPHLPNLLQHTEASNLNQHPGSAATSAFASATSNRYHDINSPGCNLPHIFCTETAVGLRQRAGPCPTVTVLAFLGADQPGIMGRIETYHLMCDMRDTVLSPAV